MENKDSEVNSVEQPTPPSSQDIQTPLKNKSQRRLPTKTLLLVGLIAAVGIILALILILSGKQTGTSPTSKTSGQTIPTAQIPKFTSTKYEDRSALGKVKNSPLTNASIKVYPLKNNLTAEDVRTLRTKLNLENAKLKKSSDDYDLYTAEGGEKDSFLLINPKVGTFDFYNASGIKVAGSQNPDSVAETMLRTLGMLDATITCPVTFQKSDAKDVTYVECHRNWNLLGAPLLNPPGILNLPETKFMSTLSPGYADPNGPKDASVINTNNKQDGLSRPVDFNSVVIGVQKDGSIITISSTMRQLDRDKKITTEKIIGPQEALAKVKNNQADFTIMIPAGTGTVDMKKLYPNNLAQSNDAAITDMVLGYIEKPLEDTQNSYEPYYIVKGVATLNSGYTVKFIQGIKASQKTTAFLQNPFVKIAYAQDRQNPNNPTTPTVTNSPSPSPSTSPSPSPSGGACTPTPSPTECSKESDYSKVVTFDIPGYGKLVLGQVSTAPNTYYLISTTGSTNKQDMINAIAKGLCPDLALPAEMLTCKTRFPKVFQNTNGVQPGYQSGDPKCYITGLSPAIFLYPTEEKKITVSTGAKLTYSDPEIQNSSIQAMASPDGTIQANGITRPYLYYEYDPRNIHFTLPSSGFIVARNEIAHSVASIASHLGLNENETRRLVQDVVNAVKTNANYYFIGIANQTEVSKNLPLSVSPQPDSMHRIHIILHGVNAPFSVMQPEILPLQRNGFNVVELGAFELP